MWETLRAWLGFDDSAGSNDDSAGERSRSDVPELLRSVFDAPDSAARRAVYADWLIEQGDPLGAVINLELQGAAPHVLDVAYARHLPRVLGDLAPILQPTEFALGLPVAGVVKSGRPDLLDHPQWAAFRWVQTDDPAVAGALANRVPAFHVVGFEAFEALAMAPGGRVQHVQVELSEVPDRIPTARFDSIAVRGLVSPRPVIVDLLKTPVRTLRVEARMPPDPALIRQFREHPTLERFIWKGGQWGSDLPVPPLPNRWRRPPLPEPLVPIRWLTDGATRRFWLVYDPSRGDAFVAGIRRRMNSAPPLEHPDVVKPVATFGSNPEVELYPPDLVPLGARPWPEADEVQELLDRIAVATERVLLEETLLQVFRTPEGIRAVAPVLGHRDATPDAREAWALKGSGWAAAITRGLADHAQKGFRILDTLFVLVDGEPAWDEDRAQPFVTRLLEGLAPDATLESAIEHLSRLPLQADGAVAVIARLVEGAVELAWLGDCAAYAVHPSGITRLTRDDTLGAMQVERGVIAPWEVYDHDASTVPVAMLGAVETARFRRARAPLGPDDRLFLCTGAVPRYLEDPVLAGLLCGATLHGGVEGVRTAHRDVGSRVDIGCVFVDPALR